MKPDTHPAANKGDGHQNRLRRRCTGAPKEPRHGTAQAASEAAALAALTRMRGPLPHDVELIDEELRHLLAARAYFQAWSDERRRSESDPGGGAAMSPAQFLRAWNDSTARIIQLLRARRQLAGERGDTLDELMSEVCAQLAGAEDDTDVAADDDPPDEEVP